MPVPVQFTLKTYCTLRIRYPVVPISVGRKITEAKTDHAQKSLGTLYLNKSDLGHASVPDVQLL